MKVHKSLQPTPVSTLSTTPGQLALFFPILYFTVFFIFFQVKMSLLFSQVNSDIIYWQRTACGTFAVIHVDKSAVGHSISTKAVGSDKRVDITHLYKHPEGDESLKNNMQHIKLTLSDLFFHVYQVQMRNVKPWKQPFITDPNAASVRRPALKMWSVRSVCRRILCVWERTSCFPSL